MNQLTSIQILRAFAAWAVTYQHLEANYIRFGYVYHFDFGFRFYNIAPSGEFGVGLFFVISGFIMYYSLRQTPRNAKDFLIQRIVRIVPAYWFFTFVMAFLSFLFFDEIGAHDWNLKSLLTSLFLVPAVNSTTGTMDPLLSVGWTLFFEMFFYTWLTVCILLFSKYRFLICSVVLLLLPNIWNENWLYSYVLSATWLQFFVYGLGIGYCYTKFENTAHPIRYVVGVVVFSLAFLVDSLRDTWSLSLLDSRAFAPALSAASLLCFEPLISTTQNTLIRALRNLGDTSYSTYLLHYPAICLILLVLPEPKNGLQELSLNFTLVALIVVCSIISYRYIERGYPTIILKRLLRDRR